MSTGIRKRGNAYEASVWVARDNKRIRKTFATSKEAKAWRATTTDRVNAGTVRASSATTLRQAWDEWLEGARSGLIRTRSGDRYKPSALHGYEKSMANRVLARLGDERVDKLSRQQLQELADELYGEGLDPSTIRNTLMPIRALYRRLLQRGQVGSNPTANLALPAVRGKRDRIVTPEQARGLLEALPEPQRPLWATALYAGLRRGELMALRFEDLDFDHGVIKVERSYDPKAHEFVEPKSRSGRRTVPMASVLRAYLASAKLSRSDRTGLVFSVDGERVFDDRTVAKVATACWRERKLEPVTLHECRHTFASLMIRAGVNVKALASYMGHASITITLDRYGHLLPGNESEAAELLDTLLVGTDTRLTQVGLKPASTVQLRRS
jgi:integrase